MCIELPEMPSTLVVDQQTVGNGNLLLRFALVLGKVTTKRNGQHISSRGFSYPIGCTVFDNQAKVGDHIYGLHFLNSPANASLTNSYGSHRLAVLPSPHVWDPVTLPTPENMNQPQLPRCWHSSSATTLFCCECDGVELDVLNDPNFLRDLQRPRSIPGGHSINALLARNFIWSRQVEVNSKW